MQSYASAPSRNSAMASPAPGPAQRAPGLMPAPALAVISTPAPHEACEPARPVPGFSNTTLKPGMV